ARERIVYRPIPYEIAPEPVRAPGKMRGLWLAASLVLVCVAVVCTLLTADLSQRQTERPMDHVFSYRLFNAPWFLSEELALAKARRALSHVVPDPSVWKPVENADPKASTAPDGRRDVYLIRDARRKLFDGIILFESTNH